MASSRSRSRTLVAIGSLAVVILVPLAAAFACSTLATLNLSAREGQPGATVVVTGSSFRATTAGPSGPLPVVVHWNGVDGPAVASAVPDASGAVSATFVVPSGGPGDYVLVATQGDAAAGDRYGVMARADYRLLPPAGAAGAQGASKAGLRSLGMIAATLVLGVLGLGLFCGGFVSVVSRRRLRRPARARLG